MTVTAIVVYGFIQFYSEAEQCERSMFHAVYRMHKELRDASVKPTADVSCLLSTVEVSISSRTLQLRSHCHTRAAA